MIDFLVVKIQDGTHEGLGVQSFRAEPRVGEFVTFNDEQGIGQAYQVKAVLHPIQPGSTAGELIVAHFGTELHLRKTFE